MNYLHMLCCDQMREKNVLQSNEDCGQPFPNIVVCLTTLLQVSEPWQHFFINLCKLQREGTVNKNKASVSVSPSFHLFQLIALLYHMILHWNYFIIITMQREHILSFQIMQIFLSNAQNNTIQKSSNKEIMSKCIIWNKYYISNIFCYRWHLFVCKF